ncbi:Chorismate dehydratase [Polystyrenella longa]|uniref:Chorismate dehydratase n=1 Tax=Polystyrenella longa TaxID=2528007 RepID=A0A518CHS7_9PLAN|nr:menaquinone biosynthesis protein [Polystyrenella longa]QDU78724.1 Chorismate dehydratase [Polystyrenella longa]
MTDNQCRPLRIGAVSYLNAKPLVYRLAELAPAAELKLDYPSRLADQLAAGELDVALIPSIEITRNPSCKLISDACIASCGPVLSVRLYSRVHPGKIRTLALDVGSRTSATLVRIFLSEKYGVQPELAPLPFGKPVEASECDAILMIGDRAMHVPEEEFEVVWDLGEEWYSWTGLPFVFAAWAARTHVELGELPDILSEARNQGVEHLAEIAAEEAPKLDLSPELAENYLRNNLHFHLGSAERNGLRLFQDLATYLPPGGIDIVQRHYVSTR